MPTVSALHRSGRSYVAALVTSVALTALAVAPAGHAETGGVWSGTTKSDVSGTRYSWRFENKGDRVDVQVSGQRNGETYPIECSPGRFVRGQEFVATCHYLKAPPGVAANATFELRAELSNETTEVTYQAGSYSSHFTLHKERAQAAPASPQPPNSGLTPTTPPPAVSQTDPPGPFSSILGGPIV